MNKIIWILGGLAIAVGGLAIYAYITPNQTTLPLKSPVSDQVVRKGDCDPNDFIFTESFTETNTITSIIPPVWTTPTGAINHTALINTNGSVPVYMPADGTLFLGSHYDDLGAGHYQLDFEMDCGLVVRFDHITDPVKEIAELLPASPNASSHASFFENQIPFKAGQLIGHTTGTINAKNWNIGVYVKGDGSGGRNFDDRSNFICPFTNYPTAEQKKYINLFGSFGNARITTPLCDKLVR